MGAALLLLASFAVILAGALLFTNAVEWAGHRLDLGQGAVGSLLAAVGTAMPETLIPIVAVIEGEPGSEEVAIGAIVGAPFLLATIAMMLVGLSALGYRRRREQGHQARGARPHARPRPRLLPLLLRPGGDPRPGDAARACASFWPSPSWAPMWSTSGERFSAAGRSKRRNRSAR